MSPDGIRDAEIRKLLLGLPPGERLGAVARMVQLLAEEDRGAQATAGALEECRRRNQQLQDKVAELESTLLETRADATRTAARLKAEEDAVKAVRDSLTQLRAQYSDAQTRLQERDAQIDRHQQDMEGLRRQVQEARQHASTTATGASEQGTRVTELQERVVQLQHQLEKSEALAAERAAVKDAELESLKKSAHAAVEEGIPGWLAEHVRRMRVEPVLANEPVDQTMVVRIINIFEILLETTNSVNELVSMLLRKYADDLPKFKEQARAYLQQNVQLRDLVRNALSPHSGDEVIVQRRLGPLVKWLRAIMVGVDAALQQEFVSRNLRDFLSGPQREWRSVAVSKFANDQNGTALIAREITRWRADKIAEAFEMRPS